VAASLWPTIVALAARLNAAGVAYEFVGSTALFIQGVAVQGVDVPDLNELEAAVQWDGFETVHNSFSPDGAGPVTRTRERAWFTCAVHGVPVRLECVYNTVIATDPHRVRVERDGHELWAKSVLDIRRHAAPGDPRTAWIDAHLREAQAFLSRHNQEAWSQNSYDAWVERHGGPAEAAARIAADPAARLAPLGRHLGELRGVKVANLLGSHGAKAVAMALLGADVTVVDISPANAAYATALAAAAGVPVRYVVADVLSLPAAELTGDYGLVLMELGVLHYFVDLAPLADTVARLLRPGGRLVLHDFHPVSTKLITSTGKKHKVTGNYFDATLAGVDVAYTKYLPGQKPAGLKQALQRRWTLGEIVTAVAGAGLFIRTLDEEPNHKLDDLGIPKTFTLVAERPQ
jgi:SAM-dependent methyltransferase